MSSVTIAPGISREIRPAHLMHPTTHVMSLVVDHRQRSQRGIARVVFERIGDVAIAGYVDRSELRVVTQGAAGHWEVGAPLTVIGAEQIIAGIEPAQTSFIGLEDPEIIVSGDGTVHVFFTLPFVGPGGNRSFLGHASGNLERLVMQPPVLTPLPATAKGMAYFRSFKELCLAPANSRGSNFHLVESRHIRDGVDYSTVAVVEAAGLDKPWTFLRDEIHPAELRQRYRSFARGAADYAWCAGHVSPCRLLPPEFVTAGSCRVGILNGREATVAGVYGKFRPGLFLYDPETGRVPWVDPQPLFDDPQARTIIFASDVVLPADMAEQAHATLITHIDDSYVQHYRIDAAAIRRRLPPQLVA